MLSYIGLNLARSDLSEVISESLDAEKDLIVRVCRTIESSMNEYTLNEKVSTLATDFER